MRRRGLLAFGLICVVFGGLARAADNTDPSGVWTWSVTRDDNVDVDFSVKLIFADNQLTGTITIPNGDKFDLEDTAFKDGEVKFSFKQQGPMNRIITTKYQGKLDGDEIKGTYDSNRRDKNPNREWHAKRENP